MNDIEERLKKIVSEYTEVAEEDIDFNASIKMNLGIDSFGLISMINTIEDEFNVRFPEEELINYTKLADLAEFIEKN